MTENVDPELFMRRVQKDVEEESFTLQGSSRYMTFNSFMRIIGHFEHYTEHCHSYDPVLFEDYAERIDCVLGAIKPKWRGHVIVYILYEFISKAYLNDEFDDRIETHILFWQNHLFRQKYIGTITRYSQYTDLLLKAIRLIRPHDEDINRSAIDERYVTYMWRAFSAFRGNELVEAKKRLAPYKEGIIAAAWHPRRLERWLDMGYSLEEITELA
jgi:hypothetical protein